jgi:hypothetical protein
MIQKDGIVLEIGSGLGGRAATMANSNNSLTIYSLEKFETSTCKDLVDSSKSWIKDQIADLAKSAGFDRQKAINIVTEVEDTINTDQTGKSSWAAVTKRFKNIKLIDSVPELTSLDALVINSYEESFIKDKFDHYISLMIPGGKLITNLYVEGQDQNLVTKKINFLVKEGWSILDTRDSTMVCVQKPTS